METKKIKLYSVDKYGNIGSEEWLLDEYRGELINILVEAGDVYLDKKEAENISRGIKKELITNKATNYPKFSEFKANDKQSKDLLKILVAYIKNKKWEQEINGFLILGNAGVGKTYSLQCLASALIERAKKVRFVNVNQILDEVKNTFDSEKKESDVIDNYKTIDFLFIDDFGAERKSDFSKNLIYKIIDYRYVNNLPTFFSSNYTMEELQNINDIDFERIVSRIQDKCQTLVIKGDTRRNNNITILEN